MTRPQRMLSLGLVSTAGCLQPRVTTRTRSKIRSGLKKFAGSAARFWRGPEILARGDVHLSQRGDELTVHVGSSKRKTLLPRTLAGRPVLGARLADQRLVIRFGERPAAVAGKGR